MHGISNGYILPWVECKMERYDMNYDNFVSGAASIGGGFVMGILIGYFLRKILKLVVFALGGVFSLLVYLEYQGLISVNVDKVQYFANTITNSIANSTTNILLHPGNKFTMIPYWIPDLTIPFTGSMAVGITTGFLRG